MTDVEAPSRRRPTARLAVAYVLAEAVVLIALIGPLIGQPWWSGFRRYFSNDQLSYAGIAANVAGGDASLVEPFALTADPVLPEPVVPAHRGRGPRHHRARPRGVDGPRARGRVRGRALRRLAGAPAVGAALAPVLPALALLTGVLAAPTVDYWYAGLGVHAVVWGPYGTLFTLNAEAAGLSLLIIAMVLLVWAAWSPSAPARRRAASVLIAAALIGLLAGVQTYSFFTGVTLSLLFVACRSLLVSRSRPRTWATVGLLTTALIVGGLLTDVVGPFPILGLVLLSLTPALWPVVRARPLLALAAVAVAALASAPQIVRTLPGLAADNPPDVRQDSTDNLGVLYSANRLRHPPAPARVRGLRRGTVAARPADPRGPAHRGSGGAGHHVDERPLGIPSGAVPVLAPVHDPRPRPAGPGPRVVARPAVQPRATPSHRPHLRGRRRGTRLGGQPGRLRGLLGVRREPRASSP